MVAGGGGSGHNSASTVGGNAGGLISYRGEGSGSGSAATQESGYGFGSGGPGLNSQAYSGSGSGYWGGASSNGSGGVTISYGGSSYISGFQGVKSITEESTSSNMEFTDNIVHYSGYAFTDAKMIDGSGYEWKNGEADTSKTVGMPTTNGTSTENGHLGNGYARISLVSVDETISDNFDYSIFMIFLKKLN